MLTTAPLAAAILISAGCSTGTKVNPRQAHETTSGQTHTRSARGAQQTFARPADPQRDRVDFGPDSPQTGGRHAELIGLYGELVNAPVPTTGRFDGAGNIAQITAVTEGACFQPDVARDGRTLVFASTQHRRTADIYFKTTTGKTQRRITADPADDMMPALAPDGRRIAFASNRFGNWDIFVTDTEGAPPMPITEDVDDELHPTWSPDGRKIAYCKLGSQSGRWELWVVDLDSPSTPQFLEYGLFPQFNPDPASNKIVFQRARERGSRMFSIWTIDYVNGEAVHPTEIVSAANAAAMHPAWSPDGRRIVFVTVINPDDGNAERPAESDLWVINANGTGRTNLMTAHSLNLNPVWAADGTVYFLSDRSGTDNIWAVATARTIDLSPTGGSGYATADPNAQQPNERP
jgi:TolB protein